jgi:DNA-binding Lrp family transcriptional regulator
MKRPKFDHISVCILEELQRNARISNQELAEKVALSPSACLTRLRKLETEGVLPRFKADIALEKVIQVLWAYIEVTLENHDQCELTSFLTFIHEHPNVVSCHRVCGPFDYLLYVVVRDMSQLRDLTDKLLKGELGVTKVSTLPVMEEIKPFEGYPLMALLHGPS